MQRRDLRHDGQAEAVRCSGAGDGDVSVPTEWQEMPSPSSITAMRPGLCNLDDDAPPLAHCCTALRMRFDKAMLMAWAER